MVAKKSPAIAAAAAAVAAVALLTACTGGSAPPSESKTTLTVALQEVAAANFDPALGSDTMSFQLSAVYDTLLRQDSTGELFPNLATEWGYDSPTELSMSLRDDVTFADGSPLDAAAVVANLEAVKNGGGPYSGSFAAITTAEVVDDTTVRVVLEEPNPTFFSLLTTPAGMVANPAAIDAGTLSTKPDGSGPYTLTNSAPGQSYQYEKRDDYWNSEHYPLQKIVLNVFTETQAKLNALQTGQADITEYSPDATIQPLLESGELELAAAPYNTNMLLLLDRGGEQVPALADVRVRQAINFAIDRDAIATIGGGGDDARTPTAQLPKPGQAGFREDLNDLYPHDVEAAKRLLTEAGYADGFSLPMVSISYFDQQAQALAGSLAEIGITLEITNVPIGQYVSSITSGEFASAYFANLIADPYADIARLTLPDGAYNPFGVSSPELEEAYGAADLATSADELDAAMAEVNRIVVEEAWLAPFLFDRLGYAHTPSLQGIAFETVRPATYYDWSFGS